MSISSSNRKIYVVKPSSSVVEDLDIISKFQDAQIDLATISITSETLTSNQIQPCDAIVLILSGSVSETEIISKSAFAATQAGAQNVVGIWHGTELRDMPAMHPALQKYSTAQIGWCSKALAEELGADCPHAFVDPDGNLVPETEIDPHECEKA